MDNASDQKNSRLVQEKINIRIEIQHTSDRLLGIEIKKINLEFRKFF